MTAYPDIKAITLKISNISSIIPDLLSRIGFQKNSYDKRFNSDEPVQ